MKKINNQRGFATLEIILVFAIIGIFSGVAVPKMARTLDKVYLDYEMKHLYSDLNFARSIGKSSTFSNVGIFPNVYNNQQKIEFWVYGKYYNSASAKNRYQIMRPSVTSVPFNRHNLSNDITLDFAHSNSIKKIEFDNKSHYRDIDKINNRQTLTLQTKFGYEAKIVFDTVGRWRGTYEK